MIAKKSDDSARIFYINLKIEVAKSRLKKKRKKSLKKKEKLRLKRRTEYLVVYFISLNFIQKCYQNEGIFDFV